MFEFLFGTKKKKFGLALGGGSIRGIAHVGVLKVLIKNNIQIDYIAGTSAGSIIASLYASGMDIEKIEETIIGLDWFKVIYPSKTFRGIFSSKKIEELMKQKLPVKTFSETKIPLAISTTNLLTGREFVFRSGKESIALAVRASSTVPGLFEPVSHHGMLLVDGCLTDNVPVSVAKLMGAQKIVGVNVIPEVNMPADPKDIIEVISRSNDIYVLSNLEAATKEADLMLLPIKEHINVRKPSKKIYKKLIEYGEAEAKKYINVIKSYARISS